MGRQGWRQSKAATAGWRCPTLSNHCVQPWPPPGGTQTGKGAAGIHWHVLALGTERSRETASTQTLKLRLTPVLFDAYGNALDDAEQFISDAGDPE